jgi:hypothetical protein
MRPRLRSPGAGDGAKDAERGGGDLGWRGSGRISVTQFSKTVFINNDLGFALPGRAEGRG